MPARCDLPQVHRADSGRLCGKTRLPNRRYRADDVRFWRKTAAEGAEMVTIASTEESIAGVKFSWMFVWNGFEKLVAAPWHQRTPE
jgi:hypothetical protein